MRKYLSIFLTVVLLFTSVSIPVHAVDVEETSTSKELFETARERLNNLMTGGYQQPVADLYVVLSVLQELNFESEIASRFPTEHGDQEIMFMAGLDEADLKIMYEAVMNQFPQNSNDLVDGNGVFSQILGAYLTSGGQLEASDYNTYAGAMETLAKSTFNDFPYHFQLSVKDLVGPGQDELDVFQILMNEVLKLNVGTVKHYKYVEATNLNHYKELSLTVPSTYVENTVTKLKTDNPNLDQTHATEVVKAFYIAMQMFFGITDAAVGEYSAVTPDNEHAAASRLFAGLELVEETIITKDDSDDDEPSGGGTNDNTTDNNDEEDSTTENTVEDIVQIVEDKVTEDVVENVIEIFENNEVSVETVDEKLEEELASIEAIIGPVNFDPVATETTDDGPTIEDTTETTEVSEEQYEQTVEFIENIDTYVGAVAIVSASDTVEEGWAEEKVELITDAFIQSLNIVDQFAVQESVLDETEETQQEINTEVITQNAIEMLTVLSETHDNGLIEQSTEIKASIEKVGQAISKSLGAIVPETETKVEDDVTTVEFNEVNLVFDIQEQAKKFQAVSDVFETYYGQNNVRDFEFNVTLATERVADNVQVPISSNVIKSLQATNVDTLGVKVGGTELSLDKDILENNEGLVVVMDFADQATIQPLVEGGIGLPVLEEDQIFTKEFFEENEDLIPFDKGYTTNVEVFVDGVEKKVLDKPVKLSFDLDQFEFFDDTFNPSLVSVFRLNEDSGVWEPVGGVYDPVTNSVSTRRIHLSQYTVMQSNKSFNDVEQSWAQTEINALLNKGVVNEDMDFNPQANVSREEVAAWMTRTYGLVNPDAESQFADVGVSSEYASEIASGFEAGLFSGKGVNNFDPDGTMTREELAALVGNALVNYSEKKFNDNLTASLDQFDDLADASDWSKDYLALMIELDLLPAEDNKLNPKGIVSKELAASVISKISG